MFRQSSEATLTRVTKPQWFGKSISGLVVEYIVAIDVTRVRFPADAMHLMQNFSDTTYLNAELIRHNMH